MRQHSFLVIGGGAVGLATAWRILERFPGAGLTLLEKESAVCRHQTGNNSGVLHCGLAYRPGTEKARLAVRGIRQITEFCAAHGVRHEICGKLVVATRDEQVSRLQDLFERGTANGLKGLEILTPEGMREIEPHVAGVAGLRVPEEGIVDYPGYCETLARLIEQSGGCVVTSAGVSQLRQIEGGWVATTPKGEFRASFLITCAGLQADRIARLAGERPGVQIVPFRGDYFKLAPDGERLVRNLIYPVVDKRFPFLGVHLTRLARGGIEAGPNAALALKREGYGKTDFDWDDAAEALTFPGLWRFAGRHLRMCTNELRRAFSKRLFCESLQTLVPEIEERHLSPGGSGVRAQAMRRNGQLVEDFDIIQRPTAIHVLNAPSPAATASLAIGEKIAGMIG
ncbi:MAG TPA: L-2-hydroxyglutarate oxidase [Bryobacteraceae bacterium]|nr:L-2-hydroxyglutarate oxidase [Bryobacteraceae bacterium]